ncbi:MAG: prepilin-type N-terminal cleavage/methylation domain-containing protein [Candidatus Omnitrophota bacterium]|nr:prepilin-type N-terminal cleavage/methylation domain-containing protein [Candidatus Omnitrophota bacterium]
MLRRKGFTLVEIMIVVAIIGLLAAIAIPNFIRARQQAERQACIANLKQIQGAVQVWALDNNLAGTAVPTEADLVPNYIKSWPRCGGVAYGLPVNVDTDPICPRGDATHTLTPAAPVGP